MCNLIHVSLFILNIHFDVSLLFFHNQETYQDPSAINIESEDFKALPAEIQHELIKEIKEERKWMNKHDMPRVWLSMNIITNIIN